MNYFNLNKIIEVYNIDVGLLAKALFPKVKYPKEALSRVIKGEANLDTEQLQLLASYLGVLPADLFSIDSWVGVYEDGLITLKKGEYTAKLNYNGAFLTVYKNEKVIKQEVLCAVSYTIPDLVKLVNTLISKL